jgi:hypothetical protein
VDLTSEQQKEITPKGNGIPKVFIFTSPLLILKAMKRNGFGNNKKKPPKSKDPLRGHFLYAISHMTLIIKIGKYN